MNKNNQYDVIIVGAGYSGVICALGIDSKIKVLLIDANEMIMKKFLLTGNGFANITNVCDTKTFLDNVIYGTKKFLYYAHQTYGHDTILKFLQEHNFTYYQREKTTKIFLKNKNSNFIAKCKELIDKKPNLSLLLKTTIKNVQKENDCFYLVDQNQQKYYADQLVIATGGLSYSKYANTKGFGYQVAKTFQHPIQNQFPMGVSISPIPTLIQFITQTGNSFENVVAKLLVNNKLVATEIGDLMITHNGVGGPIIRRISSYLAYHQHEEWELIIELVNANEVLKALNEIKQLSELFTKHFNFNKKFIKNFYQQLNFTPTTDVKNLSKINKQLILEYLTNIKINKIHQLNLESSISTGGGVDTKLLDPKTFESKLIPKLFFIGEVNNTNALTGGFNLTVCFASAKCCNDGIKNNYNKIKKH